MTFNLSIKKAQDSVDEFRAWERTHNSENYGRYDAFRAGYLLAVEECARVADEQGQLASDTLWRNACRAVAAAIRQITGDAP